MKRTTPFGWPWEGPTTDVVPGLLTPAERIESIRQMGSARPERHQELAMKMDTEYRQEEDPMIRAELVRAIGGFRTSESIGVLETALNDANPEVRIAACEGCGRLGGDLAVSMLGQALHGDVDVNVRQSAAKALGATKTQQTAILLSEALESEDPGIRYLVIDSLQQATGQNFGNDAHQWQQYVQGGMPETNSHPIAQRIRQQFD